MFGGGGVAQDSGEALKWLRKAAEQGSLPAQAFLGAMYGDGQEGVSQNYAEALKWTRKAAEQNFPEAQYGLGLMYKEGKGVQKDFTEAVKWWQKAAEQGSAAAQYGLGNMYRFGQGVEINANKAIKWHRKVASQGYADSQYVLWMIYRDGFGGKTNIDEAVKWLRLSAEQGNVQAQLNLAGVFVLGHGVPKDYAESFKWAYKAADQGHVGSQFSIGISYLVGIGVSSNIIEAYKWFNLSAAKGNQDAKTQLEALEKQMTLAQIDEAQKLTREYKPGVPAKTVDSLPKETQQEPQLTGFGSGFYITDDGYLISNNHVVEGAKQIRVVTSAGISSAKVVRVDAANDLALLKAEGKFSPLPVTTSRGVKLGSTVATVGFPNIGLQGFAPKLAKGEIASLSGPYDDARFFQISAPVQPGNSGGALVDERGNVVGVVSAKLSAKAALAASGSLPENVNYAVKSSFLLSFLESVPDVANKLKEPNTKAAAFEDVVKSAQDAAVLVLVY